MKWFVRENYSESAIALKRAYVDGLLDLHAPNILPYEVINGIKYTYHLGEVELLEIAKTLDEMQITLHDFSEIMAESISISLKYGITIYDASYIAVAKSLNDTMYTADEKLLYKVKGLQFVKNVKDFSLHNS